MKLLTEIHDHYKLQLIEESNKDKTPNHYIQGLFLEFDHPNKNHRIYRSSIHDPGVNSYIKEKVNNGMAWGELDHPPDASVSLKNTSHRIVEMYKEGTNWHGKAIVTNTIMGNTVKGLLECGGNLGVSSRGMGSVKQVDEGIMEVQGDFKLLTAADIVSDPSAHGALVKGLMENQEFIYDESIGTWLPELAYNTKNQIKKLSLKEIEEKKLIIFEKFLNTLKNANLPYFKL